MKKVVVVVACLASFLAAKECKTMADLINGCIKTEYRYDKKPIKQSEWKNKKEVRVIYRKSYHDNGNLASDCRGEGENEVCKYYYENGEFRAEYRGDKPFQGEYAAMCGFHTGSAISLCKDANMNSGTISGQFTNGIKTGIWKEGDEEGEYVNGKKNGIWKRLEYNSSGKREIKYQAEYKDGKLIKFIAYGKEYEYLGNEENIRLDTASMLAYQGKEMRLVEKADENAQKNCTETLLPDKEGNTNPNNKMTSCFVGKDKKIRDGLTTISIERDVGLFLKDIRVFTFEIYLDKGKIIKDKSKCQYDWKKFEDTTKLEEILNSGKKYTAKTYYDFLYAACQ